MKKMKSNKLSVVSDCRRTVFGNSVAEESRANRVFYIATEDRSLPFSLSVSHCPFLYHFKV